MVNVLEWLELDEISGVDNPAHGHPGWLVMKENNEISEKVEMAETETNTVNSDGGAADSDVAGTVVNKENPRETRSEAAGDAGTVGNRRGVSSSSDVSEVNAEELALLRKANETLMSRVENMERVERVRKAAETLQEYNLPGVTEQTAGYLASVRVALPEAAAHFETVLKAASTALTAHRGMSHGFTRGNAGDGFETSTVLSALEGRAAEMIKKSADNGVMLTIEQAKARIIEADPGLVEQWRSERAATIR